MGKLAEKDMTPTGQSTFPFETPPVRYEASDYLISQSNLNAWRVAIAWEAGDEFALAISGPQGSGKTHLATILADRMAGAGIQIFDNLPGQAPHDLMNVLSDLEIRGGRAILIGRGTVEDWSAGLNDLRTRLSAAAQARIEEPDETLIIGVLNKMFGDRQLNVDMEVTAYVAPFIPRTFAAALQMVDRCDSIMMRDGKKLTKSAAKKIATALFEPSAPPPSPHGAG